ncbi:MAG: DinB family protein [Longimicrobiales bacterium]|nr:DinB family protein [Longimicrobiales bacterium]
MTASGVLDGRPGPDEVTDYYRRYIEYVPDGRLLPTLARQLQATFDRVDGLGVGPDYRYDHGKWSVKEVLVHLADAERVFGYRALRIGRGDPTPMPGFEQDDWIVPGDLAHRSLDDVKAELTALREGTVALFRGLTDDALLRKGTADGVTFTPRAIAWIIAGHELHHRRVLDERYR